MTNQNLPSGALIVRAYKGRPFYEAKWQWSGRQVKRRIGPAWLVPDPEGGWKKKRGRAASGFFDQKTATVRMSELIREHIEEQGIDRDARSATFSEAAEAWLDYMATGGRSKPSTIADYRRMLSQPGPRARNKGRKKARIMSAFGKQKLRSVTTPDIDRFLARLDKDGISPRTVNKHRQLLHAIFEYCRKPGTYGLGLNPVSPTEKRRERTAEPIEYFTPEEVAAIARVAEKGEHRRKPGSQYGEEVRAEWERINRQDAALFVVAAQTGLRLGEIRALQWRDIDFSAQSLTVSRAVSAGKMETPKSGKMRTVGLADQAARLLDDLSRRPRYTGKTDLVFCRVDGGALDGSAINRRFKSAQETAGINYRSFHKLRHSFASQLVAMGFDPIEVKTLAGHASITTTERYLHARSRSDQASRMTEAFKTNTVPLDPAELTSPEPRSLTSQPHE